MLVGKTGFMLLSLNLLLISLLQLCGSFTNILYSPWNSPGQNTGVGSLSLLQVIFPNSGIELRSPALQVDSLPAEPQ